MKFISVKAVPMVFWSSAEPLNPKPRLLTLGLLCLGLLIFGVGEASLIAAGAGVSPWIVLSQGVSNLTAWSVGFSTFVVSLTVLLLWLPLRQKPGIGTILNAVVIAAVIDVSLRYLPSPDPFYLKVLQSLAGVLVVGIGSGLYLCANLGPGPRDGLMTGLQRRTGLPIAVVRTTIEITAVILGWSLGGVVGVGTVLFALGIGPAVSAGLYLVMTLSNASRGVAFD
ncbi:MAG TPA: hypothetical protein QGI39_04900 [Gammaproteobacteria bacterium]|jgi:hypothetical protein|nr:hypothetical protein [Gammaproteobacteria bacterium]